jgi:hypothetical protein
MSGFELTAEFNAPLKAGEQRTTRSATRRRLELVRQEKMRLRYGSGPAGETCGACLHLTRGGHGGWIKCAKYSVSASEASDWRKKWPACGAFESVRPLPAPPPDTQA